MKEGVFCMATSSIYTDVKIKDKSACRKLVRALEGAAKAKSSEKTVFSRQPKIIKGEKIKEIFNDNDE